MELWIRSQDKRQLLKVNDGLYIANGFTNTDDTFIGIKNVGHVGRYAEEERALEVLDEIQNILKPQLLIRRNDDNDKVLLGALQKGVTQKIDMEYKELSTYVYEMP